MERPKRSASALSSFMNRRVKSGGVFFLSPDPTTQDTGLTSPMEARSLKFMRMSLRARSSGVAKRAR